jgi:hypothetical protein
MAVEQSVIELIFEKQKELDAIKFVIWLTSNYEGLKHQYKNEIMGAFDIGQEDAYESGFSNHGALVFYKETYGE